MTTSQPQLPHPLDRTVLLASAGVGFLSALTMLLFMSVEHALMGLLWGHAHEAPAGWFDGPWRALLLMSLAGLVVGLLRERLDLHGADPNFIDELKSGRGDAGHATRLAAIAMPSLVGGASVGPEAPLVSLAAGIGTETGDRLRDSDQGAADLSFAGVSAVFGGLSAFAFAGPVVGMELQQAQSGERFNGWQRLVPGLLAAIIAIAVLYPTIGAPFLRVHSFDVEALDPRWLLATLPLAALGVVLSMLVKRVIALTARLGNCIERPLWRATAGGFLLGITAFILPLTQFSGQYQLGVVLDQGATLGLVLLLCVVLAKSVTLGVSLRWGFFGGAMLPLLFIGGTLGHAVHLVSGLPPVVTVPALAGALLVAFVPLPFLAVVLVMFLFGLPVDVGVVPTTTILATWWWVHGRRTLIR